MDQNTIYVLVALNWKNYQTDITKTCHKYTDPLRDKKKSNRNIINNYPTALADLFDKDISVGTTVKNTRKVWKETYDKVLEIRQGNTKNGLN